jgi:hypothetical protein
MDETNERLQWRIALRAFELYELDGCHDGKDLEYWLQAESEILAEMKDAPGTEKKQVLDMKTGR